MMRSTITLFPQYTGSLAVRGVTFKLPTIKVDNIGSFYQRVIGFAAGTEQPDGSICWLFTTTENLPRQDLFVLKESDRPNKSALYRAYLRAGGGMHIVCEAEAKTLYTASRLNELRLEILAGLDK